jgi:hypothetical protein
VDSRLSLNAKGIMTLILVSPRNWDNTVNGLVKLSNSDKQVVIDSLKELSDNGYLIRETDQTNGINYRLNVLGIKPAKQPENEEETFEDVVEAITNIK